MGDAEVPPERRRGRGRVSRLRLRKRRGVWASADGGGGARAERQRAARRAQAMWGRRGYVSVSSRLPLSVSDLGVGFWIGWRGGGCLV